MMEVFVKAQIENSFMRKAFSWKDKMTGLEKSMPDARFVQVSSLSGRDSGRLDQVDIEYPVEWGCMLEFKGHVVALPVRAFPASGGKKVGYSVVAGSVKPKLNGALK